MQTYPLEIMTLEQATHMQFRLVDVISKHFNGQEFLNIGDVGLHPNFHKPEYTNKVESVIANFFEAEAAVLTRGAGTGAIHNAMNATLKPLDTIIVHDTSIYPTTEQTIRNMGLNIISVDFNKIEDVKKVLLKTEAKVILIQLTRQNPLDNYSYQNLIDVIKDIRKDIAIITDDNYAVMKVLKIGVQAGADLSCFSLFKLFGPAGIGCVVGSKKYIDKINKMNYSGGCQVQGFEAMDALRSLVYCPVMFSIQASVSDELVKRLQTEVSLVKSAFIANAQSRVVLVELDSIDAKLVINAAQKYGAAIFPVGAESRYEVLPMFYKVSGTFLSSDPTLANRMIRINPMRSGADTIINILKQSIADVLGK